MKMMDKKINNLLSFSVFFLINELVGLEFYREFQTWNDFFIKDYGKYLKLELLSI